MTDYMAPMRMMTQGGIYPDAFEQGAQLNLPDMINEYYLGAWAENVGFVGFYRVQQMGIHLYQAHANIMKGYRRKYALKASQTALKWLIDNIEGFETLICMIPTPFEAVQKHVQAIGMQSVGKIPNAFKKNDSMHALKIFAITKEQIKCRQQ